MPEVQSETIVVVLGCTHGGLAVIRSLGQRDGIRIVAASHDPTAFALSSRYVDEIAICPYPKEERAFVDFLLAQAERWPGALLIESTDYYTTALANHRDELLPHYRLVAPTLKHTRIFLEKDRTYALAAAAGVPHPEMFRPEGRDQVEAMAGELLYPVMVKPVLSHEFVAVFKQKLFICESSEELLRSYQRVEAAGQEVIVSEIIPGSDFKTLERVKIYINSKRGVSAEFSDVKIRQTPPMYGVMRVGKSTPPNEEALRLAHRLLSHIGFRGSAAVEFKRDHRNGQLKLIEVNVRQARSLQLSIASGVDLPWIIYQDLVLDQQAEVCAYDEDTYLIDLLADIVDFVRYDESKSLRRLIAPYLGRKAFAVWSWRDPKPFLRHLTARATRGLHKRRQRRLAAEPAP